MTEKIAYAKTRDPLAARTLREPLPLNTLLYMDSIIFALFPSWTSVQGHQEAEQVECPIVPSTALKGPKKQHLCAMPTSRSGHGEIHPPYGYEGGRGKQETKNFGATSANGGP